MLSKQQIVEQTNGQETSKPIRVLNIKSLCSKVGRSRASIYNWMNPKSPHYLPRFPKPIRIGIRSVGWLENEIDDYLAIMTKQRDGSDK
jgi:prophage regulatory protein